MARLVGAFAASHGPLLVRGWQNIAPGNQQRIGAAFRELGRRLAAAQPDLLIEISPDHWVNFFIDNLPAICIGVGSSHDGPPEPFLADFPHRNIVGDAPFARHLLRTALAQDFEPAMSHHVVLDHGFCIPLWRMELATLPRIVPIIVNDIEPPMMSLRRALAWGRLLKQAIDSYPEDLRVAILASGGLSHSIGEPTMGEIDEAFDAAALKALGAGGDAPVTEIIAPALASTGNGAEEVRNWVIAHGAAGSRGFELVDYLPVPEVYVGCGFASWRVGA